MKKIALFIFLFVGFQSVKAQDTTKTDTSSEKPFLIVQQMPEFVGGQDSLFSYLEHNLIYPESAKESNKQGTVYVSFVISKTGKITNVKITRGVNGAPELDAEAVKIVQEMPDWIPGRQDGKNVPVQYALPLKFILNNAKKKK